MDFVGYALISGTDENAGKYVDAKGNIFRLDGNKMIAVETGTTHAAEVLAQEGELIGGVKPLPGGMYDEPGATVEKMMAEITGEGGDIAPIVGDPADVVTDEPVVAGGDSDRVSEIMSDYGPDEVRAMLYAARNRGADVEVLNGDDETTARKNAAALARVTE